MLSQICLKHVYNVAGVTQFSFEIHLTNAEEANEDQENAVSTLGQ